jgi:hypothetical protein
VLVGDTARIEEAVANLKAFNPDSAVAVAGRNPLWLEQRGSM